MPGRSLIRLINRRRNGYIAASRLEFGCERSNHMGSLLQILTWGLRYSTMDNIDGKQARRTGTSSGLGELFEYEIPGPRI